MTSVSEAAAYGSALEAALGSGLRAISRNQEITFVSYTKQVLPLDGFVFWIRNGQTTVRGSLHYSVDKRQNEDETLAVNRVIFSTTAEIQAFNSISPNTIFVAELQGGTDALGQYLTSYDSTGGAPFRAAFSRRDPFLQAAKEYHYVGDAVYPALASQLIDTGEQLAAGTLVVNNSLPVWLALQSYSPIWLSPPNPGVTLYPSFAVPDNIVPPYGTVHIDPARTESLQAGPLRIMNNSSGIGTLAIGTNSVGGLTQARLTVDRVRVTLYGLQNDAALNFIDLVNQYSLNEGAIGIMNMPAPRDEKRTQTELAILAQKKTIDFEVSYFQGQIADIAMQLITSATATISLAAL